MGAWGAGTYEVSLVVDGSGADCALKVLAASSQTAPVNGHCTSTATLVYMPTPPCTSPTANDAACSVTPGARHFFMLTLPGTPARVEVTLTRDGALLLQERLNLTYATTRPNGPVCPPTCYEGQSWLTVDGESSDAGSDGGEGGTEAVTEGPPG
jgi:hypothetical protein